MAKFDHLRQAQPFHGDCSQSPYFDEDDIQVVSGLNARGQEVPDSVPTAPPIGYRDGPSLTDTVHRLLRQELKKISEDMGYESPEEGDDFDIEDDPIDPLTPYEAHFEPSPEFEEPSKQGSGGTPEETTSGARTARDVVPAPPPAAPSESPPAASKTS